MYTPTSKLEVEDLLFAVDDRKRLIKRSLNEATSKDQPELAKELSLEFNRLDIISSKLVAHVDDYDYVDDVRCRYFECGSD